MKKNKRYSLNIYNLFGLAIATYCIYFLLLRDNVFPFSIASVLNSIHRFVSQWPVLIVGLLPIYIALMIFGIATLGFYLGSLLERFVLRFNQQQKRNL